MDQRISFHDDEEKAKEIILRSLTEFWNSRRDSSKNSAKATNLVTNTAEVINLRPVKMIINNNIAEQRKIIQKQLRASIRDDIIDQGYEDAKASLRRNDIVESTPPPKQEKEKL